jgi:hypothetical protein
METTPNQPDDARPAEGEDFYREGPFTVFTEAYLRRRGYCCESGCRHCPWGYDPSVWSRGR